MYTNLSNIKTKINLNVLIQLLDDDGRTEEDINFTDPSDPFVVNFSKVEAEAEAEINAYLAGRYSLPFASVPLMISNITDDITIYNAYKRRSRENIPASITMLKKDCNSLLEKIAAGKIDLGLASEPQSLSCELRTNKTAKDRLFNRDMWERY